MTTVRCALSAAVRVLALTAAALARVEPPAGAIVIEGSGVVVSKAPVAASDPDGVVGPVSISHIGFRLAGTAEAAEKCKQGDQRKSHSHLLKVHARATRGLPSSADFRAPDLRFTRV